MCSKIVTDRSGFELINTPILNKGTAFDDAERDQFGLHGLLPPHVGTLDDQVARRLKVLRAFETDFERYGFLRELQDSNETLFYALLVRNVAEMLPLVYTPTVGEGCQRFSEIWHKPRGVFLSYPNRSRIRDILSNKAFDDTQIIVVSDGERILGLGDQGAGGMGIPIGKLSLYAACAGIHPSKTLPILLDVGTNNKDRLDDPLYIGWRHERIGADEYESFVEAFVTAVQERWPDVLLQWEDFAGRNAPALLARYRDRLCSFNDDIQGTAAVAAGTLFAAMKVGGLKLGEQTIVLLGGGSAGCGIAGLLVQAMIDEGMDAEAAHRRIFMVDRDGLLVEGMAHITEQQKPFLQKREAVEGWKEGHGLLETIRHSKAGVLIGVSGQAGSFSEEVVRAMAGNIERPVIFPLSNPTSASEATPSDILAWTDGRALIGTGSPFKPVEQGGRTIAIDQTNNSYIFPGMGLGILACGASRVTDTMFMAAAKALAEMSPAAADPEKSLLPPVEALRDVAATVALAVARQAGEDGVAERHDEPDLKARIAAGMWEPRYLPYRRA